jgi:hypothetical protein
MPAYPKIQDFPADDEWPELRLFNPSAFSGCLFYDSSNQTAENQSVNRVEGIPVKQAEQSFWFKEGRLQE